MKLIKKNDAGKLVFKKLRHRQSAVNVNIQLEFLRVTGLK